MFAQIIEKSRNKIVFVLSILIISATSLWGIFYPDSLGERASSTFVLGIYTSGGNPNPSAKKKVAWGITQLFLALALLLAGGLEAL